MIKRIALGLTLVALGAGAALVVSGAFIAPHFAAGNVNTAVSGADTLYICQPQGSTVSPICPIDTNGADETIFAATENLLAGQVAWQKIRVRNTGTEPWDILSMAPTWTEVSDPGGTCTTIPEGVIWNGQSQVTEFQSGTGPGVTLLGNSFGGYAQPVEGTSYQADGGNDNHGGVSGSALFPPLGYSQGYPLRTIHVAPGGFDDLLLGIRLPIGTPTSCLDVVWQLSTNWQVQLHIP